MKKQRKKKKQKKKEKKDTLLFLWEKKKKDINDCNGVSFFLFLLRMSSLRNLYIRLDKSNSDLLLKIVVACNTH